MSIQQTQETTEQWKLNAYVYILKNGPGNPPVFEEVDGLEVCRALDSNGDWEILFDKEAYDDMLLLFPSN